MVNINIEIPDELHHRLRLAAALKGVTLKQFVTQSLDAKLEGGAR